MFSVKEARHKRPHLVGSHVGEMSEAEKPQTKSVSGCQAWRREDWECRFSGLGFLVGDENTLGVV